MKSLFYKNKLIHWSNAGTVQTGNELQSKPTLQTPHYYGLYPLSLGKPLTVSLNFIR